MNTERLMLLVGALEDPNVISAQHFNLSSWRALHGDEDTTPGNEALLSHACGTTACALGWACALPEFNKQGLVWDAEWEVPKLIGFEMPVKDLGRVSLAWASVCHFFGIEIGDAERFFLDEHYPTNGSDTTPGDVARRIRAFINDFQDHDA